MELYGHNEITYDKALNTLRLHHKCCVIQATGTGKTFVTMQLLNTIFNGLRVLYVVPTISIAESIELYDEWQYDNVTFVTYSSLHTINALDYDVLILDEVHRAGATTYLPKVKAAMAQVLFVLGLSATEFRYLDSMRSMARELFGNHVVYGPDIVEAVRDGILPGFQYVAILTEIEDWISENKITDPSVIERVHYIYNEYTLSQRIQKYIKPEHKKCVVFYPNYLTMDCADDDLREWLGEDVHIYELKGNVSRSRNKKAIDSFNADTSRCVLKAVNKANEGIHVKGVTLLIFARKTESGNIFLQQLGRGLSASNKTVKPTIIDLVQNYNNIKVIEKTFKQSVSVVSGHGKRVERKEDELSRILISYDDVTLNLEDVVSKILVGWTDEEDAILRKYYNIEGSSVYVRLDGRTQKDCTKRARVLGLTRNRKWTVEEDDILRKYWDSEGIDVFKRLSIRTSTAIYARARFLGLLDQCG